MGAYTCRACGFENKEGTSICNKCGNPLDVENKKLLNMRYDGRAIRSKTRNQSIVDKIWNFFSSIKVGVTLIAIALVASAIGTIFPQEIYIPNTVSASEHYRDQYGIFGQIYYQLGFHQLYSSWWYMLLIALIGISIFIVSLDRGIPLYKALKHQNPKKHAAFLKRQKLYGEYNNYEQNDVDQLLSHLRKKRYRITEKDGHYLAEKGRFSRWGPYVNHLGLIIFLLGTLLRFVPFMYIDEFVWVREGETEVIPGTDQQYYVKNEKFIIETYGEEEEDAKFDEVISSQEAPIPKNFQTNAVVFQDISENLPGMEPELKEVKSGEIIVNEPMKFDGLALYQDSYQLNEFQSMSFKLHEKDDANEKAMVEFTVDLTDPKSEYTFDNGFRIELDSYYPDFVLEDGMPKSRTNYPRNPGFVFFVYPPNSEEPEVSFLAIGQNIDPNNQNNYKIGLTGFDVRNVSGLKVKRDYTLPVIGIGAFIFMIGVVQGMYWQHRRIWIHPEESKLLIACHTNKNWFGMKKEWEKVSSNTKFKFLQDQEDKE